LISPTSSQDARDAGLLQLVVENYRLEAGNRKASSARMIDGAEAYRKEERFMLILLLVRGQSLFDERRGTAHTAIGVQELKL
jgi:hypothetical protein